MNFDALTLILLVLGFIPHHLSRTVIPSQRSSQRSGRSRRSGRLVRYQIHALFWRLTIDCPAHGRRRWRFTLPVIRRLADAVWAALRSLLD